MFCGHCGHHIPDTNNFCCRCGTPILQCLTVTEEKEVAVISWKKDCINSGNHGEITGIFPKILKKRIIIDLTKVTFIDSVGIGTLVTLYYKINRTKQEIRIVGVNHNIMRAIKALGVDNVLEIRDSKEHALAEWGIT